MTPRLPLHLRILRGVLRRLNYHLNPSRQRIFDEPFDKSRLQQAEEALRQMSATDEGARAYLEKHIPRLARTLTLVPPPPTQGDGRVLELGCYMQITPLLARFCGYREVRGAYQGPLGQTDRKTVATPDGEFTCLVDH